MKDYTRQTICFSKKANGTLAILLLLLSLLSFDATAQTKGLIIKPAVDGQAILDPNLDGYISKTTSGFVSNDQTESEIPFKSVPLPESEPINDLARGPGGGFSDFVDNDKIDPVSSYLSPAGNLMFRFRLGNIAANSKGYSILIDTDQKFGNSGSTADPNYVVGNPGFEVEIVLETNFGVRLNNVDGSATPTSLILLPYDHYCQKGIAYTTQGGNADYFYDFYIPFSVIKQYITSPTFTETTPIRMVANTVISPKSALTGGISDIGGIDDTKYGDNFEAAWSKVVTGAVPTSMTGIQSGSTFPPVRSKTPVVNGPLKSGETIVTGTSTEPAGTTIKVYANGTTQIGTATVQTGGTWSASVTPLVLFNDITATATAAGYSESLHSTAVRVFTSCSPAPTNLAISNGSKGITGSTTETGTITVRFYNSGGTLVGSGTFTNVTTWTVNYGTTGNSMPAGSYYATVQQTSPLNKCESSRSEMVCESGNNPKLTATATPTISTPTTIYNTTKDISGRAETGSTVYLYVNGEERASVVTTSAATGDNYFFTNRQFSAGQTVTVRALATGKCVSAPISMTVQSMTVQSAAPKVNGPLYPTNTIITGTSTEIQGTTITVLKNATSLGTTTVGATGSWSYTAAVALVANDKITATATASGKTASALSNEVIVLATTATPTITGSYVEAGTSVTGTSTAAIGTTIKVFIDGYQIGSTTVASGGNWTLTGLSATLFDLYAGGRLTATATETGKNESTASAPVTVQCIPALANKQLEVVTSKICEQRQAQLKLLNSEKGIIYTLRNSANTAYLSNSVLGTGGDILFNTYALASNQSFLVESIKPSALICQNTQSTTGSVGVFPYPDVNLDVTGPTQVAENTKAEIKVLNTKKGVRYQLAKSATQSGSSADGNTTMAVYNDYETFATTSTLVGTPVVSPSDGATVSLFTDPMTQTTTYEVIATDINQECNCESTLTETYTVSVSNVPTPVTLKSFTASSKNQNVLLKWITANEVNNDYFEVQKSDDGITFHNIGIIDGAGNSNQEITYTFTDKNVKQARSYYRLRQVDFDGKFEMSNVINLNWDNKITYSLKTYPNPFTDNITISLSDIETGMYSLIISDLKGNIQYESVIPAGKTNISLSLGHLNKGMYILTLKNNQNTYSSRLVKQ